MSEEQNKDDLNDENKIEEAPASIVAGDGSEAQVTEKDFARFIGDNAVEYLPAFRRFDIEGIHKKFSWHWPAFSFGFLWMAYRRMYGWALAALFLECFIRYLAFDIIQHPILAEICIRCVYGLIADYLYYKYAWNKILDLKRHNSVFELEKEGGVNRWMDFILNKELRFRTKKRATEVQAGKYAKYVAAILNIVIWLLLLAGAVFDDEALLMGGAIFGMMLLFSYSIPIMLTSKSAPKDESDSWGLFFMWLNIGALAVCIAISYIQKLLRN